MIVSMLSVLCGRAYRLHDRGWHTCTIPFKAYIDASMDDEGWRFRRGHDGRLVGLLIYALAHPSQSIQPQDEKQAKPPNTRTAALVCIAGAPRCTSAFIGAIAKCHIEDHSVTG